MIKLSNSLYIDEELIPKQKKIIKSINKKRYLKNVYCIAIASNESNVFDIYNVNELFMKHYDNIEIKVVALSASKSEAVNIVARMVEEAYTATGNYNIREYYLGKY